MAESIVTAIRDAQESLNKVENLIGQGQNYASSLYLYGIIQSLQEVAGSLMSESSPNI